MLSPHSSIGPHRSRRPPSGFTLIELVIAIGAMALVLVYTLGTFTANRNTYVVIDQVSEAHQNILAIATILERDIRAGGYMVPDGAAACGLDNTNAPDSLFVSDTEAIRPADQLPASLAGIDLGATPTTAIPASWSSNFTVTLDDVVVDGQATYDTDATPGADSDFRRNAGAILVDVANPDRGVGCAIVASVNAGGNQVTLQPVAAPALPPQPGADFRVVPAHVYQIAGTTLQRNGVNMARDVEDLQLAWFYDDNGDGQATGSEYRGVAGNNLDTTAVDGNNLREIRFNLVLRTSGVDPSNPTSAGVGQATENQTAAPDVDGRRRRVHTATVRLRNLAP